MGLLTPDALDVLSHAAVRARNSSVLLATCSDAAALHRLRPLAGRTVALTVSHVGTSGVLSSAGSFHDVHRVVPLIPPLKIGTTLAHGGGGDFDI